MPCVHLHAYMYTSYIVLDECNGVVASVLIYWNPCRNMITQAHALNLLIKFVSFSAKHKNIFREVGLLSILTNCLQMLWKELSDAAKGKRGGASRA